MNLYDIPFEDAHSLGKDAVSCTNSISPNFLSVLGQILGRLLFFISIFATYIKFSSAIHKKKTSLPRSWPASDITKPSQNEYLSTYRLQLLCLKLICMLGNVRGKNYVAGIHLLLLVLYFCLLNILNIWTLFLFIHLFIYLFLLDACPQAVLIYLFM